MDAQQRDFAEFYRGVKDECLLTVLVSVGDRDAAQEQVAEAFARAWASWQRVGTHPAPEAWVVRTALNAGVSRWWRRREVTVADAGSVAHSPTGRHAPDDVDPVILAALMRLPARQRQVVALRLFLDLDTARTAAVLGIAPGTVQARSGPSHRDVCARTSPANYGRSVVMNDDELITLVRAQRDRVPMTIPVDEIVTRGRALRTRRRIPRAVGVLVLGLAAGAALTVKALTPAAHDGGQQTTVRLVAWTVAKLADGNICVTIRELKDPAGRQRTLRADGVPASVTFLSRLNPACHLYPGGMPGPPRRPWGTLLKAVLPTPCQHLPLPTPGATPSSRPRVSVTRPPAPNGTLVVIVVDRSALPRNARVQRAATRSSRTGFAFLLPEMAHASSRCTGR